MGKWELLTPEGGNPVTAAGFKMVFCCRGFTPHLHYLEPGLALLMCWVQRSGPGVARLGLFLVGRFCARDPELTHLTSPHYYAPLPGPVAGVPGDLPQPASVLAPVPVARSCAE